MRISPSIYLRPTSISISKLINKNSFTVHSEGMKKNIHTDHKSNLNTSCASDLHSSILSSLCETNMSESLMKIDQLKLLYAETCHQQASLLKENSQFIAILDNLKRELQILVDNKFGPARIKKKQVQAVEKIHKAQEKSQMQYKAGSIAKIRRVQESHRNKYEQNVKIPEKTLIQPLFQRQKQEANIEHKNRSKDLGESSNPAHHIRLAHRKTASSIVTCHNQQQLLAKLSPNTRLNQRSHVDNQKPAKLGMLTQRQEGEKPLRIEKSSKKSYLNSPQTSLLNSPRSALAR